MPARRTRGRLLVASSDQRAGTRKAGRRMFARTDRSTILLAAGLLTSAFALTACGTAGSSGTSAPPTQTATGAGCAPAASDTLVLLTDDKHLQSSDNIIAVANAKASTPALIAATDKVGA